MRVGEQFGPKSADGADNLIKNWIWGRQLFGPGRLTPLFVDCHHPFGFLVAPMSL